MPITIKATIEGYRRAGMAHSSEPTTHPDGTFTEAQIKQLKADPRISVSFSDKPLSDEDTSNKGAPSKGPMDGERISELVALIEGLDKEDPSLWKQDNTPKAAAFPAGVSAEERTQAWEAYLATLDISSSEDAPKDENSDGEK
ncbi:hypothetical protein TW85_25070 [Marinomonas sp. S3726]|uniref:HI1506-related protein n=1 Tax=Marinomonas sp. S3726 TaxID=579484 RepID=UPI0005FA5A2C|nr:HI1506-related protein [Marinomonas sp. S3726]KJZ06445.1 hypothetical protein TW85_25070 [Marinomonas sp. S3726]